MSELVPAPARMLGGPGNKFVSERKELQAVLAWLQGAGFSQAHLEVQQEMLILHLSQEEVNRLLAEVSLRKELVARGQAAGFHRVTLELVGGVAQPGRAGDS